ncbi:MAG: hypothetical protein AB7O97_09955 [Planctomycetota bacterium]
MVERVGAFFVDVELDHEPQPADPRQTGRDVDLLSPLAIVGEAAAQQQTCLVYLCDRGAEPERLREFERRLFADDDLGLALRRFRCVRIDVGGALAAPLRARYDVVPVFVVCDRHGRPLVEVPMPRRRPAGRELAQALERAFGRGEPLPLKTFVKRHGKLVRELEKVEQRRRRFDEREATLAADDDTGRAALARDRERLAADEQRILTAERELLEAARLPARPEAARRLGGDEAAGDDRERQAGR